MQQSNKQCNYSSQKTFQKMFNIDALGTLGEGPERNLRVTVRDIPTYGLFYLICLIWLILIKVKWVKRVKEVKRSYDMILSKKNGLVTTFTISWLRCCDKDCALCDNFLTQFGGNLPEICSPGQHWVSSIWCKSAQPDQRQASNENMRFDLQLPTCDCQHSCIVIRRELF